MIKIVGIIVATIPTITIYNCYNTCILIREKYMLIKKLNINGGTYYNS